AFPHAALVRGDQPDLLLQVTAHPVPHARVHRESVQQHKRCSNSGFDVVHVPIVPEPTAQRGNGTQTTDKGTSPPPPAERFPCCRTRAVPALSRHFGRVPVVLRSW